ncbi:hypothetical protein [Legionella bononiensis]|nr:hypothetical protein [Legionella bononiensis]
MMIAKRLKIHQHRLQIHKAYLRKVLHQYGVLIAVLLSPTIFIAVKYRKSGRFLSVLLNTLAITAPRLLVKNLGKANTVPFILIQTLVTAGFTFLTNKIKR